MNLAEPHHVPPGPAAPPDSEAPAGKITACAGSIPAGGMNREVVRESRVAGRDVVRSNARRSSVYSSSTDAPVSPRLGDTHAIVQAMHDWTRRPSSHVLCVNIRGTGSRPVAGARQPEVAIRRSAESCAHPRLVEIAASDDDVKGVS